MSNIPDKLKIAIAGAGGIGSHLTAMLFDFGVNRNQFPYTNYEIDVFDDDTIEYSNLIHQNFSETDIGNSKTQSLAERYAINPINRFMNKEDIANYDIVFSAVDSMTFRKELYEWSWENPDTKTFWIDGRCESRQGAVFNKTNDKKHLQKVINESQERKGCLLPFEKEARTAHALPIVVAGFMLQTFLNHIRGTKVLPEKMFMI
jgi:molybdopterin/thiamine biosynthesis adenylyltransferase